MKRQSILAKTLSDVFFVLQVLVIIIVFIGMAIYTVPKVYRLCTVDLEAMIVVEASGVETPRPTTHQVMPGDTIWSIYVEYYKGCDWDEVCLKVGQANGLKNDTLYPYTVIKLPEVTENG